MEENGRGLTAEMYRSVVAIVDDRVREIRVTRQDFDALKGVVGELAEAQKRTEIRVEELAEAQRRTEDKLERLEEVVGVLGREVKGLAGQVGALSENIGFGLEDIAHVVLPGYLERHYGIKMGEFERRFFEVDGKRVEINLYGEGEREGRPVVILGEAKSRIYRRQVEKFKRDLSKVTSQIARDIVKVMFGYWIHPTATEAADTEGILLVASYQR